MTITVTHATVASGTPNPDADLSVNEWNEAHSISQSAAGLLGAESATTSDVITIGDGLEFNSGALRVADELLDMYNLSDPGADRMVFWDDTAGSLAYLEASTGLSISATAMSVDASLTHVTAVGTLTTGTWEATDVGVAHGGTGASTAGDARTNLGLAIGTDVQAYDALLADIAALSDPNADELIFWDDSDSALEFLGLGDGLAISVNTMSVDIDGLTAQASPGSGDYLVIHDAGLGALRKVDWSNLPGAASGDQWGDAVDADIVPTGADSTYDLGSTTDRFAEGYIDTLTLTNALGIANGGTGASLSDPNADRIMFWDDSDGSVEWLTPGEGLTITVNDLDVDINGLTEQASPGSGDYLVIYDAGLTALRKVDWANLPAGGGGDAWSDPIDSAITVDTDSAYDIGTGAARLATVYVDDIDVSNDLLMASGSIINFDSSDVLITHSANTLTLSGGYLHIDDASVSGASPNGAGDNLVIDSSTTAAGMSILTGNTGTGWLIVGDSLSNAQGWFAYNNSSHIIQLGAGGNTEVAISATATYPYTASGNSLGTSSNRWWDIYLANDLLFSSGGIINFNGGDVTVTHSANALTFAGASNGFLFSNAVAPSSNDAAPLGSATVSWSDLFLASGGVINWDNGDVTATHAANALTFAGATSGYVFSDGSVQITTLEIGHATDTTLSRSAAGILEVEGVKLLKAGKTAFFVHASQFKPATTSGAAEGDNELATNDPNYWTLDFDATSDEHAHYQFALGNSWDAGTITYQVYWDSDAADTDGVAWAIQARATADNEAIDGSWGTAVVVTDSAQSAADECYITSESAALTIGNTPGDEQLIWIDLYRDVSDAADTATEDARLIGVMFFVTTDQAVDT